jgi:acyl-CoA synthetase (AMP-forming)/AMP-acid ligase II
MVAGAPPPPAVIAKMKQIGIELTHVYGLTEVYGPASVCAVQDAWKSLPDDEQARLAARQGVRYHLQAGVSVLNPTTMEPVPNDGETLGEIMFRGNICMKGYLKNERATDEAFRGGWFHTGDLGVMTPDGYIASRTAARTSSSRAARTFRASRWRTRCTAIRRSRWPPWSRCPIRSGAKCRARSSSCVRARARRPRRSSRIAGCCSPASRCRAW